MTQIPVIDIFAGPGGLGEGFSSFRNSENQHSFKIGLSVEKDKTAHQTLLLRSFFRQFLKGEIPVQYYDFLKGEITLRELFSDFPDEYTDASNEAWCAELGKEKSGEIDRRIRESLNESEKWVLIGGPPCQAYSIVGRSRKGGMRADDPRVYLYREYYRILAVHNPPVFIMENVKGILSASLRENEITDKSLIFKQILNDLSDPVKAYTELGNKTGDTQLYCPGYTIYSLSSHASLIDFENNPVFKHTDYIIKSEKYGIPQSRHRVILLGIRNDIKITPGILKKHVSPVTVENVLSDLPALRSGISGGTDSDKSWEEIIKSVLESVAFSSLCDEQKNFISSLAEKIVTPESKRGSDFISCQPSVAHRPEWYLDEKIGGVCNHQTRSHMVSDLYRYLFVSSFAYIHKRSPKLSDFPANLLPFHKNVEQGVKGQKFADRFRVHLWKEPARTITSHISKDGHYYIHPDPRQCRSFTVREAARIQTFPDNYYFCGNRTEQYVQVGNAVPPLLALQLAEIVYKVFCNENYAEQKPVSEYQLALI
jgi:DNA (cytosine-5)-methyltransferase 1